MAFPIRALVFFMVMAALHVSLAVVYNVGESVGWTRGGVDYNKWAASKSFHVGDVIVFVYNKGAHNVLEVSQGDYTTCNSHNPIATYSTGKDSITIKSGDNYFICGFPGHCQQGQKVNIKVKRAKTVD